MAIQNSAGEIKTLEEAIDWQLDKTVLPHRIVIGIAGKTASGTYVVFDVDDTGSLSTTLGQYSTKITEGVDVVYIAYAVVGSAQADAVWQAKKILTVGVDMTITWADGNSDFDNVVTDLTALTYT